MTLKLNGSTNGSVSIDAPADTSPSGTDVTLTLPTSAGSSGQYLQTNGSGTLSWQTVTDTSTSVAVIADVKSNSTGGGTFTSGGWRTRDLNTEISDANNIVSISSNQFTLIAGTYLIQFAAPAYAVSEHRARLYDITNSTVIAQGINSFDYPDANLNGDNGISMGAGVVTITSNTTYEIQHRCSLSKSSNGLGVAIGFSTDEHFTTVTIWKVA